MNPIAFMILVQPAFLCLVTGMSLLVTGSTYLTWIKRYSNIKLRIILTLAVLILSFIIFFTAIVLRFDQLPIKIELIMGL